MHEKCGLADFNDFDIKIIVKSIAILKNNQILGAVLDPTAKVRKLQKQFMLSLILRKNKKRLKGLQPLQVHFFFCFLEELRTP